VRNVAIPRDDHKDHKAPKEYTITFILFVTFVYFVVFNTLTGMKLALLAGNSLHHQPRVFINQYAHINLSGV
jgi:hypothetical protein